MEEKLLDFIKAFTNQSHQSQMTLRKLVTDTYPDPSKTSWNDTVSWTARLTFGRGYFSGAMVGYEGRWAVPHPTAQDPEGYKYNEAGRDLPVEEAVKLFLSDELPEWAKEPR